MKQRQIKFRALKDDMSNCNFVYGQLVYDAIGCPRITEVDSSGEGLKFNTCIRGTEGQYTGMKDGYGKEIYEGDIVNWKQAPGGILAPTQTTYTCLIQWDEFMSGWQCKRVGKEISSFTFQSCHIEVIGNIYENPITITE